MLRRTLACAVVLAVAFAVSGCGGSAPPTQPVTAPSVPEHGPRAEREAREVRETFRRFGEALRDSQFREACALMTPALQIETSGGEARGCAGTIRIARLLLSDALLDKMIRLSSGLVVTVDGARASSDRIDADFDTGRFRRLDGTWLLATDDTGA